MKRYQLKNVRWTFWFLAPITYIRMGFRNFFPKKSPYESPAHPSYGRKATEQEQRCIDEMNALFLEHKAKVEAGETTPYNCSAPFELPDLTPFETTKEEYEAAKQSFHDQQH